MLTRNPIRQWIARLLLGLLVLMQVNSVVFRHSHRLSNGQIITHAHPYNLLGKSCPFSANPHTNHELLLLDAVSNAAFLPVFALVIAFLLRASSLFQPVFYWSIAVVPLVTLHHPTLRGPPCLSPS